MRFILIVTTLLFFSMGSLYADEHTHPINDNVANSEADRLMAMFYELDCREDEARVWYNRSLEHFPKNELTQSYLKQMPKFLKGESAKWAKLARKTQVPLFYAIAITCDRTDKSLWVEIDQIIWTQHFIKSLEAKP